MFQTTLGHHIIPRTAWADVQVSGRKRQARARCGRDGSRRQRGEDGRREGAAGNRRGRREQTIGRHNLLRTLLRLPQEVDLRQAGLVLVLELHVVEGVGNKPQSASRLSRGERRPLVHHPLIVNPKLDTLVNLAHLGNERRDKWRDGDADDL